MISIHALSEEGDLISLSIVMAAEIFLSTPSARRATGGLVSAVSTERVFLSTPSARRATCRFSADCDGLRNFYPRPPRGGRRAADMEYNYSAIFLSTPSARRATSLPSSSSKLLTFLSTPSARRATGLEDKIMCLKFISIHALREEGDRITRTGRWIDDKFLSTPSARRATTFSPAIIPLPPISIHALREEGDRPEPDPDHGCQAISIHALREEGDRFIIASTVSLSIFLSTPSARRATVYHRDHEDRHRISIHALREEGDDLPRLAQQPAGEFLSTPSARRATDPAAS